MSRFVLRGGYGLIYQRATINDWIDLAINPPFVRQQTQILEPAAVATYDIGRRS